MSKSKIIVANQDLVLQDLSMLAMEIGAAMDIGDYFLVFDEAHHVPAKAIELAANTASISYLLAKVPFVTGFAKDIAESSAMSKALAAKSIRIDMLDRKNSMKALFELEAALRDLPVEEDSHTLRFKKGEVPAALHTLIANASSAISELASVLGASIAQLKNLSDETPKKEK